MTRLKKRYLVLIALGAAIALAIAFVLTINCIVIGTTFGKIGGSFENRETCAVVLGAKVHEGGRLSNMLRDRMDTAIALYHEGKVNRLLLSGDDSGEWGEVTHMKAYAIENGIPGEAILEDPKGYSTYETMLRAKEVYGLDSIVAVTQKYHLYRALYIADDFGMEAKGACADLDVYSGQMYRDFREILARIKDFGLCLINGS
ncbi:MAG: YdcF family protein [Clostridia bacterium]|nr:YdcF family protein [Clostridia bacterium]